ncbi:MAG: AAA family ATPase [Bacilli bacterium]|nr:AAA family ATPase [Bacilli bacterium]
MRQTDKPKVFIYYGPRKEFDKLIKSKNDKEDFMPVVQEYDRENKRIPIYVEGQTPKVVDVKEKRNIKTLVVNSDEYSTITEGAVQNLIAILDGFDIEEIYLQNPPKVVVESLKKVYQNISEDYYDYGKIDLETIKVINRNYQKKVIGQDKAIKHLLRTLLSFVKFPKTSKPLVIMFYGPSGVGKTETAKYLSKKMGGEMFYKQFSMFQNNDFSTYLFGGLNSQNSFAKELMDRNSNVILLDEFDKAHNHFYSAFYQLFDEGIYTDKNYNVKLDNAIIICTSNYKTTEEIREKLGDPIYYRFNAFIEFNELDYKAIEQIVDIKYDEYYSQLSNEDKLLIDTHKYQNLSIKENIKNYNKRLKNARKIDIIVKEFILDILLEKALQEEENKDI